MDKRVFRMALLTIISAFILVMVIIYATNADKISKMLGKNKPKETVTEEVVTETATEETSVEYGQQIGDDLKSFLYDDDFFDETEQIPAVVVIQKSGKKVSKDNSQGTDTESLEDSEGAETADEDEEGSGMAVVGQLDNPQNDAFPEGFTPFDGNPPATEVVGGTPVGNVP